MKHIFMVCLGNPMANLGLPLMWTFILLSPQCLVNDGPKDKMFVEYASWSMMTYEL